MICTFFSKKLGRAIFSAGGFGEVTTIWCEIPLASKRTSFRDAEAERPGPIFWAGLGELRLERGAREIIEVVYILGPESGNDLPRVRFQPTD